MATHSMAAWDQHFLFGAILGGSPAVPLSLYDHPNRKEFPGIQRVVVSGHGIVDLNQPRLFFLRRALPWGRQQPLCSRPSLGIAIQARELALLIDMRPIVQGRYALGFHFSRVGRSGDRRPHAHQARFHRKAPADESGARLNCARRRLHSGELTCAGSSQSNNPTH